MAKFFADFSNIAPDTVEVQEVETTSIEGLRLPDDAVQFNFTDEKRDYLAPSYWITETVDRGPLDELKSRHPSAGVMFKEHGDEQGATEYALVTWKDPGGKYDFCELLPICDSLAFVERSSGRLLFQ